MVGVVITMVDTTVEPALPEIERSLHVALDSVTWVVISYPFVITLLTTQVRRLGDMFRRAPCSRPALMRSSWAGPCALALDEAPIFAFRLLQGMGAFARANSGAIIAELFPRVQRGRAYDDNGVSFSTGAVLGILLGGAIVTHVSWHWIFWIDAPIGPAGGTRPAAAARARDPGQSSARPRGHGNTGPRAQRRTVGGDQARHGPPRRNALGYLVRAFDFARLFVFVERRAVELVLPFSFFAVPTKTSSLLASFFRDLTNYAFFFLVIM